MKIRKPSRLTAGLQDLGRDVRLYMASAALIGLTAFGIYGVLLNLYLLRLGYGVADIGMLSAVGLLSFALTSPVAGAAGRRFGNRRALVVAALMMCAGYCLLPVAEWWAAPVRTPWVAAMQALASAGFATYMVNSSPFLMTVAGTEKRSTVFSLRGAVWPLFGFLGSALGGVLPGILSQTLDLAGETASYRLSLQIAGLILAPAAVLFRATSPDAPSTLSKDIADATAKPRRELLMVGAISLLAAPGVTVAKTFFNVYLDSSLGIPSAPIGWVVGAAQLLSVPAALLTPRLLARTDHGLVYAGTTMGIALSLLPMALVSSMAAASIGYVGVVVMTAIRMPAFTVFHQELVDSRWRSTMSSTTVAWSLLAHAGTAFGGGQLAAEAGFVPVFLAGAVVSCVSIVPFRWLSGRVVPA